jgi:hypothetical protein
MAQKTLPPPPPPPPPPPITVQFDSDTYTVNENDGTVTLTVTLSRPSTDVVTVNYATGDGTAVAGTDYTAASGTLTFPPGVTSLTIPIPIIDNNDYALEVMFFAAILSKPAGAELGAPSMTFIFILDDDPAPTCTIGIDGVPDGQKNIPGGYVPINANNDNGSPLTYDGNAMNTVPKGYYGIPAVRDFAVPAKNLPLAKADPDLVNITIDTKGLKVGGPETVVFSVTAAPNARSSIWFFDDNLKTNVIGLPATWQAKAAGQAGGIPPSIYVEGRLESAFLMEQTLTLQIKNGNNVVSTNTCQLTVTPVLTDFTLTIAKGSAPDSIQDVKNGWSLNSEMGGGGAQTMTASATAQWNKVNGSLRFIQTAKFENNLVIQGQKGTWGADLGPRKQDYDPKLFPTPGTTLVDTTFPAAPFYPQHETNPPPNANEGVVTNAVDDSPSLVLENDPGLRDFSVLPALGKTTNVDVTYRFVSYATVAYADKSLYFIGQQPWSVHYVGAVTQPANNAGKYPFTAANGNGNTGAAFGPAVRNNGIPAAIGQPFFGMPLTPSIGNDGGAGWR